MRRTLLMTLLAHFSSSSLSLHFLSIPLKKQAGTPASTPCVSARSVSSRSPRTWATVSFLFTTFFRFYKERTKKLTLFFPSPSFSRSLSKPKTGAMGSPPKIPGGATLIFETELLAINGKA